MDAVANGHTDVPGAPGAAPPTDWEKYWGLVQANPEDFSSWEELIRTAESASGGLSKDWSEDAMVNLKMVYDHFLAKFPLCFGYWKKYADAELMVGGAEKCEAVYERGVSSIHNSIDLWSHFCSFKAEHSNDDEATRVIFERASAAVGYDFVSHTFWDKYIQFEETHNHPERALVILERIIRIPLHQYVRFFEKYTQLAATRPITELLPEDELEKVQNEAREGAEGKTTSEIEADVRSKIQGIKSAIYMQTHEAVVKRWVFESEIKRSYFHVKPLDEPQLQAWRKYLDFEEAEGEVNRVYALYERCLVPCAQYEEFWLRYIRFLLGKNDVEGARNVFIRATSVFLAPGRSEIRLMFATFEEEHGRIPEARNVYSSLMTALPGHVETTYKFANFERRQTSVEKGEEVLTNAISTALNNKSKGFLVTTKAKYILANRKSVEDTRAVYKEYAPTLSDSKYLLLNYLLFELNQLVVDSLDFAKEAWELVKGSSAFTVDEKRELGMKYSDFLLERSSSITDANRLDEFLFAEYSGPAAAAAAEATSKKRGADEQSPRSAKMAKTTPGPVIPQHAVMPPAPPVAPYAGYGAQPAAWGGAGYGYQAWDYTQQAVTVAKKRSSESTAVDVPAAKKVKEQVPSAPVKKSAVKVTVLDEADDDAVEDNDDDDVKIVEAADDDKELIDPEDMSVTFASLGLIPQICEACEKLGYKRPSDIQSKAIPYALQGNDIIGLAQTGSGKTAAFALPIIQALWNAPQPFFACVMAPTRELAIQIAEQFEALGSTIGVRCAVIVGGMDMMSQAIALAKKPHVIVCTPGRLVDHLENTKGFNLKQLKYLILDEADRLLDLDFGAEIEKVLKVIPRERNTFLFSATMTSKVEKLQRASLSNPVKIEVATKYSTVSTLLQYYLFFPAKQKECYLTYVLNELSGQTAIVFTLTCNSSQKLTLMLRNLGFQAVCLHGQMTQPKRLGALAKFKSGGRNILIATDVASRGLDIPGVDVVINYDVPQSSKDYIHRVGRTARAGRSGKSITFVTQYDIECYQRIEYALQKKLDEYPLGTDKSAVLVLQERVSEAARIAHMQLKEEHLNDRDARRNKKEGTIGAATRTADQDDEETVNTKLFKKRSDGVGGSTVKRRNRK
ncbi:ribosomal RNA processing protein [Blyttiomyces sp. JEL0837]|nr:ribosomal RNA processing protein [Blyttiomyces sp. JEL0837]